jgi:bacterial/archaeal transporter family-2 protein
MMYGRWIVVVAALASGAGLALQAGFNSALRSRLGHPMLASLVSFGTGILFLIGYVALIRPPVPSVARLSGAPWWIWVGGVVGVAYVASTAAYATKIGAAPWLGLVVTGQILTSLLLDHFGLIGFVPHPVNFSRLVGAVLLLLGVVLVLRS